MTQDQNRSAVGTIVRYRLSPHDDDAIRTRAAVALGDPKGSRLATGMDTRPSDEYPLVVVIDHGADLVGGWLQLPAIDPLWIYVAHRGDEPGEYEPVATDAFAPSV